MPLVKINLILLPDIPDTMKILPILKTIAIVLFLSSPLLSNAQTVKSLLVHKINNDTAIFSGKIEVLKTGEQMNKSINLDFISVLTGDLMNYDIPIRDDGSYYAKIPVECITFANVRSDYYSGPFCLIPSEESVLDIKIEDNQATQVQFKNSINFTPEDEKIINDWPWEIPNAGNEIITPQVFSRRMISGMQSLLKSVDSNERLTPVTKQYVAMGIKFMVIFHGLLKYDEIMNNVYADLNKENALKKEYHPLVPDKSYYSFLTYFNLNDSLYLSSAFYPMILKPILNEEVLAIPDIGDKPVYQWLIEIKEIMKDLIGTDKGMIYDIMADYAYIKQLNYLKPLTEIQKRNITTYFKNKSFTNVLLAKNQDVLEKLCTNHKTSIYEISDASDKVMDSIIAKYKGKVVFVDFWATWCTPCLKAMKKSEKVRAEFRNKDVVFIYIADPSSPRKSWEQKIYEIGGEQYYVTNAEWNYLIHKFNFGGIPHYLIYDKKGALKYNHNTFMGNENMRKWIEESL